MEKRKQSRRTKNSAPGLKVSLAGPSGAPVELNAKLVDLTDEGIGIEIEAPLTAGSWVAIAGEIAEGTVTRRAKARVSWCLMGRNGGFRAGLTLENAARKGIPLGDVQEDYYDIMQLSAKADPDTIHRVYRMLAQRYHPDNPDTGSAERFRLLSEAYRILSNPEERAAYDLRNRSVRETRWRIFNQPQAAQGMEAEIHKRRGILAVLYTKRMHEPSQPGMSLHEIEDLLACPREHLEFSLWLLKENGWIVKGDNVRYSITAKGAEKAEQEASGPRPGRMLPAIGAA
jgi:hypothetical protein